MILHELLREVSCFPRYISCYIAEKRLPLGQCTVNSDSTVQYTDHKNSTLVLVLLYYIDYTDNFVYSLLMLLFEY